MYQRIVEKRSLALTHDVIERRKIAFYVGAGIDKLFVESPGWEKLSLNINGLSKIKKKSDAIAYLYSSFMEEMNTSVRIKNGTKDFKELINQNLCGAIEDDTDNNDCLYKLLTCSNLIITTNYSDELSTRLREYCKMDKIKITVYDREDLSHFICPEPDCGLLKNNQYSEIFIINLHGRINSKSLPILDSLGYNEIRYDPHYYRLLETVFSTRNVITLGTSWTDIPLKITASKINQGFPYLGKFHLSVYFEKSFFSTMSRQNVENNAVNYEQIKNWTNTLQAVYGTGITFVRGNIKNNDQIDIFKTLCYSDSLEKPNTGGKIENIAKYLDDLGDYESPLQIEWFSNPKDQISINYKDYVDNVIRFSEKNILNNNINTLNDWMNIARIERHLRHHLYICSINGKDIKNTRSDCWLKLWNYYLLHRDEMSNIDERIMLDFFLGNYELNLNFDIKTKFYNENYKERFRLAKDIWRQRYRSFEEEKEIDITLINDLIKSGWESIAAKVILDYAGSIIDFINKEAAKSNESASYKDLLLGELERAELIARSVGCFRRRIKADVISSIWNDDPRTSQAKLRGILQSGSQPGNMDRLEPSSKAAIGIGLILTSLRSEGPDIEKNQGKKASSIYKMCSRICEEESLSDIPFYTEGNLKYWKEYIPIDLLNNYEIIEKNPQIL